MSFEAKMALVVSGALALTLASNANVFRDEPIAVVAVGPVAPSGALEPAVELHDAGPRRHVATLTYAGRADSLAALARFQLRTDPAVRLERFKVEADGRDAQGRARHATTPWISATDRFDATELLAGAGDEPIKVAITAEYAPAGAPPAEPETWVLVSAGLLLIAAVSYRRAGSAAAY